MDSWERLFDELTETRRAREQALRDAEKVMSDIAAQARSRSAELRERTGRQVEVEYPASGLRGRSSGPYLRFLRLHTEPRELHIYFHFSAEGACAIHVFRCVAAENAGRKRVSSKMICFVAPGGRELRDVAGATLTVDDLVLRSFRLLLTSTSR